MRGYNKENQEYPRQHLTDGFLILSQGKFSMVPHIPRCLFLLLHYFYNREGLFVQKYLNYIFFPTNKNDYFLFYLQGIQKSKPPNQNPQLKPTNIHSLHSIFFLPDYVSVTVVFLVCHFLSFLLFFCPQSKITQFPQASLKGSTDELLISIVFLSSFFLGFFLMPA